MFLGQYTYSLDDKGRLTIPSRFREELAGRNIVVTRGLDRCLTIYPIAEWEEIAQKVNALPITDPRGRALRRIFFADAMSAELDHQGRSLIPDRLREYAGLDLTAEIVDRGVGSLSRIVVAPAVGRGQRSSNGNDGRGPGAMGEPADLTRQRESAGHIPVLLNEVLEGLNVKSGGCYLDATVGGGGHAVAILEAAAPGGASSGLDRDPEAAARAAARLQPFGEQAQIVHTSYARLSEILHNAGMSSLDGVLFDLGFSSWQVDDPERGFAFRTDGPLDMRFDPDSEELDRLRSCQRVAGGGIDRPPAALRRGTATGGSRRALSPRDPFRVPDV